MNKNRFMAFIGQWWHRKNLMLRVKNDYRKAGRLNLGLEGVLPEEENGLFKRVDSKG